jgi:hypothetical protein
LGDHWWRVGTEGEAIRSVVGTIHRKAVQRTKRCAVCEAVGMSRPTRNPVVDVQVGVDRWVSSAVGLENKKGSNILEWHEDFADLRVREFPKTAVLSLIHEHYKDERRARIL